MAFADPNVINFWRGGLGGYLCGGNGGDFNADTVVTGTCHSASCAGGGGGGAGLVSTGGSGSYGGGGGGGGGGDNNSVGSAGNGGFGGGGGGASGGDDQHMANAGNGGFGGGGGGEVILYATNGQGGAFGGSGGNNAGFGFGGSGGALGGAIFNDSGIVVIRNSTFSGNTTLGGTTPASSYPAPAQTFGLDAGGAIFSRNGSLTVENATISGNTAKSTATGGGIVVMSDGVTAAFKLDNTILANDGFQECYTVNAVGKKGAGNLIMANDPTNACPGVAQTANPQLSGLQLNTPGDTPTMAIQTGSSAVDNGDDSALAADGVIIDQRDVSRPQGPHSDIGAYEAPPPMADLSITKSVSPTTVQPGDTVTYTLVVTNNGPDKAFDVGISDGWPSVVDYVSCSETGGKGSCGFSGGTVTASFADLALNESQTLTITGTINSTAQSNVTVLNSATVTALSPNDPNSGNNTGHASFAVHNKADLAVMKSVSSTSPYWPATGIEVGDSLTYTITLTNKGPYDARNVVLSDTAPGGVTFTGCTASVGTCVWSASSASLSLSSFTNASVATLTIQAKLNFGIADGSTITNTASVTSTTNDPDSTNNAGSTSFTALNKADLFLTQTAGKLTNQQLTFTVSVKNLGPYQAKQLLLNDAMPNGTKFVGVAPGPWTCTPLPLNSTGTLSCSVSTLNLNATDSLSFTVKVTTTGKSINNMATVGAATFDPNLANNTATLVTKSGAGK
jgi:uncharacterized repeat protein (TIGR01451 family)